MLGGGTRNFPPPGPDFVFSDYKMLAPHWSLSATPNQKSRIIICFRGVERVEYHATMESGSDTFNVDIPNVA
jgi:hypothetical protein